MYSFQTTGARNTRYSVRFLCLRIQQSSRLLVGHRAARRGVQRGRDNRKFGTSAAEKAALLDSMTAWSGKYRIEGNKIIISVDASWTGVWTGKDQVRTFTLSGNRLMLQGDPTPFPRDPSKMSTVRQAWERVK